MPGLQRNLASVDLALYTIHISQDFLLLAMLQACYFSSLYSFHLLAQGSVLLPLVTNAQSANYSKIVISNIPFSTVK